MRCEQQLRWVVGVAEGWGKERLLLTNFFTSSGWLTAQVSHQAGQDGINLSLERVSRDCDHSEGHCWSPRVCQRGAAWSSCNLTGPSTVRFLARRHSGMLRSWDVSWEDLRLSSVWSFLLGGLNLKSSSPADWTDVCLLLGLPVWWGVASVYCVTWVW